SFTEYPPVEIVHPYPNWGNLLSKSKKALNDGPKTKRRLPASGIPSATRNVVSRCAPSASVRNNLRATNSGSTDQEPSCVCSPSPNPANSVPLNPTLSTGTPDACSLEVPRLRIV